MSKITRVTEQELHSGGKASEKGRALKTDSEHAKVT